MPSPSSLPLLSPLATGSVSPVGGTPGARPRRVLGTRRARRWVRSARVAALVCCTAAAARSAEAESDEREGSETARPDDADHAGSFSLRAALVGGYRIVMRYDDSPFCADPSDADGSEPATICGFGAPLAMDLALGFAPTSSLEPFLWSRLGLASEKPTDTNALAILGAGIRIYTRSEEALKIFIEPAVGLELEGGQGTNRWQANEPNYSTDLVFHLAAGPQYDVAPWGGFYVDGGVTLGTARALQATLEVAGGFQARFP